ncbi:hypothetical protein UA44_13825 [Klebsiella aerogenes]|nr:hypothetical protein UA44_13825 [Klebsiella aerogenes]
MINYTISLISPRLPAGLTIKCHKLRNNKNVYNEVLIPMANFFIDRPIFAWVLAILLVLTGTLAILSLPVEQYPDLAPPTSG